MASALISYFWTAGCVWLYLEALCVHYAIDKEHFAGRVFTCFMPLGWILPIGGVLLVLPVDLHGFGGDWRCWAAYAHNANWPFIAPSLFFFVVCLQSLYFTYMLQVKFVHETIVLMSECTRTLKMCTLILVL